MDATTRFIPREFIVIEHDSPPSDVQRFVLQEHAPTVATAAIFGQRTLVPVARQGKHFTLDFEGFDIIQPQDYYSALLKDTLAEAYLSNTKIYVTNLSQLTCSMLTLLECDARLHWN